MSGLAGLLSGIFGGLVGLGGGAVMIPLLVFKFRLAQRQAHGTSLFVIIFSGIAGTITYAMKSSVDFSAALILSAAAVSTAGWGVRYSHSLPEHRLKRYFGLFLILMAFLLAMKPYITSAAPLSGAPKVLALLAAGLVTGFLSGMMGVGGGALMVCAMVLLAGMSQHVAQGCSLLAIVPTAATGAYAHWRLGNVVKPVLPGLIIGTLFGTYLGGSIALFLPENILRAVFSVVLTATGIHYLKTPAVKNP